ncbi:MAG: type II secretion system F family protein [Gammaproteobacteria bacterium]|nr:type II secretion system F family protein [Gammaproteobacteria bacterium]
MADNLFKWSGINRQGERTAGIMRAMDAATAEAELKKMDIEIISIKATREISFSLKRKKIKLKEIVLFTRYLATMLSAGLPILQALDIISHDQENEVLKSIVVSLRTNIATGMTFADALSLYPDYFDELYCNLIRAGEKSATLDKVLNQLGKYLERIDSIKRKVKHALIYPIAIVTVAVFVCLILLIFVIPQFQTMFQNAGAQLPRFTRIILSLSDFLRSYWWLVLVMFIFAVYFFKTLKQRNAYFADKVDASLLKAYIIGPIVEKAIIARFTRTLAITLDAGLPIVEAMKSMSNIMGNRIYTKAVVEICQQLTSGNQLSTTMEATKLFPTMAIQMISVGEVSGTLPAMLNTIANYYEEEVNNIADNLSTLLEPLIIVILGIIIGCFVVAMYLPIFKLGSTV